MILMNCSSGSAVARNSITYINFNRIIILSENIYRCEERMHRKHAYTLFQVDKLDRDTLRKEWLIPLTIIATFSCCIAYNIIVRLAIIQNCFTKIELLPIEFIGHARIAVVPCCVFGHLIFQVSSVSDEQPSNTTIYNFKLVITSVGY